MALKAFKEISNKKSLNKMLSKLELGLDNGKVKSLGVIINIDEYHDFNSFKDLAELIKIHPHKLKIIMFSKNKKERINNSSWDSCFSPKDIGWNGNIKNTELKLFLNQDFDALISYYADDKLELKMLTALSKAKFKIGVLQTDSRLNDLIIKTDMSEFDVFKNEVFKYLTILNKI